MFIRIILIFTILSKLNVIISTKNACLNVRIKKYNWENFVNIESKRLVFKLDSDFDSKEVKKAGLLKNLVYQLTKATGVEILTNVIWGWIPPLLAATPGIIFGAIENTKSKNTVFA